VLLAAAGALLSGCLVYDVASVPVKVAAGTASVAGSVAVGTVKAVGSVAGGALELAAGVAQAGAVTFVEVASNKITRVPWRAGLTLAGAGDAAQVRAAERAIDIVRAGQRIEPAADRPLQAGDVVRLTDGK
jgi:hypothetical protein